MDAVECISISDKTIAIIVRASMNPQKTTFVTPNEASLQLGFIVYPNKGEVPRHTHQPLERRFTGTAEVLVVKQGRCLLDLYSDELTLSATRELITGDVVLLLSGGHGIRMLEDTTFLEIKQGPYSGVDEKVRF